MYRIAFNILLAVSLFYLPWWAGALIVLSGCFLVDAFFEAILFAMVADAFYGTGFGFHGFAHVATLYSAIVLGVASVIRTRLAW
ncbi:MAG TPA: hypothetical protein VHD69_01050 [Candidatus Paceibacterota bacterium]|jgi:hypothetical protein|nr:hypothetical protein [Candidatus Paceibacterota bacterium]